MVLLQRLTHLMVLLVLLEDKAHSLSFLRQEAGVVMGAVAQARQAVDLLLADGCKTHLVNLLAAAALDLVLTEQGLRPASGR